LESTFRLLHTEGSVAKGFYRRFWTANRKSEVADETHEFGFHIVIDIPHTR